MDWAHFLASPFFGFAISAIVTFFLIFMPIIRICRRIGRSAWWGLLMFVWPVGLWLLAYTRWPAIDPPKD